MRRAVAAVLVWAASAVAQPVDSCAEARFHGAEIVAAQKALLYLLGVEKQHCRKAPKHAACPSFAAVRGALEARIEIQTAIRELRKGECTRQ